MIVAQCTPVQVLVQCLGNDAMFEVYVMFKCLCNVQILMQCLGVYNLWLVIHCSDV